MSSELVAMTAEAVTVDTLNSPMLTRGAVILACSRRATLGLMDVLLDYVPSSTAQYVVVTVQVEEVGGK